MRYLFILLIALLFSGCVVRVPGPHHHGAVIYYDVYPYGAYHRGYRY